MPSLPRRGFLKLAALLGGSSALALSSGCSGSSSTSLSPEDPISTEIEDKDENGLSTTLLASFAMMSDTHIVTDNAQRSQRLANALNQIAAYEPKPDAILVVGDLTDHGYQEEHDEFLRIIKESDFEMSDFLFACGNHDNRNDEDTSDWSIFQAAHQRFIDSYGIPSLYYDTTIAGQHFIVLGPDAHEPNWCCFRFSETQLNWLDDLLAKDAEAGVHSYVVCHEPICDTVPGCMPGEWGYSNSFADPDSIYNVVDKYSHAVFLSGHTHVLPGYAAEVGKNIYINDGSCGYAYNPNEKTFNRDNPYSTGVLIKVYSDHIEYLNRDFRDDHWEDDSTVIPFVRA